MIVLSTLLCKYVKHSIFALLTVILLAEVLACDTEGSASTSNSAISTPISSPTFSAEVDATAIAAQTATSYAEIQKIQTQDAVRNSTIQSTQTAFSTQSAMLTPVPPGEWGGPGFKVAVLTDRVELRMKCDFGISFVPLKLDASGAFDLPGTYSWCPATCFLLQPAHYRGQIAGNKLTLTASWVLQKEVKTSGPFTATAGSSPDLPMHCPY